jgi:hypothetical protein
MRKIKIVHLFFNFQYLHFKVFIPDMNKWNDILFSGNDYEYWIIGGNEEEQQKIKLLSENDSFYFIKDIVSFYRHFIKRFFKENFNLIIHGGNYNIWLPLFFMPNFYLKRIKWICWGSQLKFNKDSLKGFFYYYTRRRVFKNLGAINFLISSEVEYFSKNYNNSNILYNPYFYSAYDFFLKSSIPSNNTTIQSIIVGNSGNAVNNHLEAFNIIKKSNLNLKIKVPLSYGYANYIDKIKEYAIDYFDEDVTFYLDFFSIDKLVEIFLQNDAIVIYSDTQSGLFALYAFLYFQKPVFLKKNSLLDFYFKDLGLYYLYLEDLNSSFSFDQVKLKLNSDIIKDILNSDISFQKWNIFFTQ